MVSCHRPVYILSPAQFDLWGSFVNSFVMTLATSSVGQLITSDMMVKRLINDGAIPFSDAASSLT